LVGEPVAVDVLELEQGAVAGLDDDGGERQFGQSLERGDKGAVWSVAGVDGRPHGFRACRANR
jgi:hypothetical protein